MTKYEIKRFSSLKRRLYGDSEKKKDSGFSWGKALGTTAAVAGTMYGAKKGLFGNSIRRGYNTVYGHVGNALGSKSMIQSAASDYARGTNPKTKADFRKAYGEFNNKFDLTKGYKTTAAKTSNVKSSAPETGNNTNNTGNNNNSGTGAGTGGGRNFKKNPNVYETTTQEQGSYITASNGQRLISPSMPNYLNGGFASVGFRNGFDKGLISYAPNAPRTFSLIAESIFYKQKIFT